MCPAISPVAAVQDEMEDRAQQQEKVRKDTKGVGSVLAQQQEGRDREECQQNRTRSHVRPAARSRCVFRTHVGLRRSPTLRYPVESRTRFRSAELTITDSELSAIAAAAMIGLRKPSAATGIPTVL